MQIQYIAKSSDGRSLQGVLEAASIAIARSQLKSQGLFPIKISPAKKNIARERASRSKHVSRTDLVMLTSQLTIMCQSGIDLAEAIQYTARDCRNGALKKILEQVYDRITSGSSVSEALRQHREVFGDSFIASIASAEVSGSMEVVLSRLTQLMRNQLRLEATLKGTLAYPVVLALVCGAVLSILFFFVLPQFGRVFHSLGQPAPLYTRLLIDTSLLLRGSSIWWGPLVPVVAIVGWRVARKESVRRYLDGLFLKIPAIRRPYCVLTCGRLFRLMGTMIDSGVPLLEAVQMSRSSVQNRLFLDLFDQIEEDVLRGSGMAMALAASPVVPPEIAQMVSTSEQTGRLGMVLQSVGEFYEDEGERLIRQSVKLLEPAIIVVMGAAVAGVVMSVILPLLDITSGVN